MIFISAFLVDNIQAVCILYKREGHCILMM